MQCPFGYDPFCVLPTDINMLSSRRPRCCASPMLGEQAHYQLTRGRHPHPPPLQSSMNLLLSTLATPKQGASLPCFLRAHTKGVMQPHASLKTLTSLNKEVRPFFLWRVPNPPGANPLVAETAPWRSSQSCVTGLLEIPTDSCHFFCTPGNPCATPIVTRGEGSFSYQGVSTRGVRHSPIPKRQ